MATETNANIYMEIPDIPPAAQPQGRHLEVEQISGVPFLIDLGATTRLLLRGTGGRRIQLRRIVLKRFVDFSSRLR